MNPDISRTNTIIWICLLLLIALPVSYQQQVSTTLTLSQSFNSTQQANIYQYYQLTFNVTNKLLMITIDQDQRSYIGIYLSIHYSGSNQTYYTYPNESFNTIECYQSSFDTCIIQLDDLNFSNKEVTVYFSVYSYSSVKYQIYTTTDNYYNVNIWQKYRVDFSQFQSGVIMISGDQTLAIEELVMVLTYNTTGKVGKFKISAAVDQIPNRNSQQLYNGVTVGAFDKILKLPPISNTSNYYILIEGQKDTKFTFLFYDSSLSSPTIGLNSTLIYETNTNITYYVRTRFENIQLPLFIRLDAYSGFGVFYVSYCGGLLNTTFQNINGQNGEIGITPFERMNCKTKMMNNGFGLLAQNIQIEVNLTYYKFGYEIGIYQGAYTSTLRLNQQQFGIFLSFQDSRVYQIEIPNYNTLNLSISYSQLTESSDKLLFQVEQCQKKPNRTKCKVITSSKKSDLGQLSFSTKTNYTYQVRVTYPKNPNDSITIEYLLQLYSQQRQLINLQPTKLYLQQIEENEYKFYEINLTSLKDEKGILVKNLSELVVNIREVNGQVALLTSLIQSQPTYDRFLEVGSDVIYSFSGKTTYYVNQSTEMVYVGVRGYEQALYYLQYTLDVDADIPAKYTKLVDGTQNNYILTDKNSYELLSFSSHIIPYKVLITGNPKCIRYGHSLPLKQTCYTELPSQFTDKIVYMNISNGDSSNNNFKFSVYINSGDYVLNDKDPLLIGCVNACYEIVTVALEAQSNVIHQGRGSIYSITAPSIVASNTFLKLSCESYPCTAKINATLLYGGQMTLFLDSVGIQQINWMSKPITFGHYPKKCTFTIRPWTDINSILIYSQALQLNVYYNLVNIHQMQTNIITYQFPTPSSYQKKSIGNPLRNIHIIQIDNDLIQAKACKAGNSYCIVAISLYPNVDIEYNENYLEEGIGFISSNTYQYFLSLNMPLHFQEKFSMSYFTHNTKKQVLNLGYKVNIEPLSNCHPKLYTGINYSNPTFELPNYDDKIISPIENYLNFTVLAQKFCKYVVTLTNIPIKSVIQNKYYNLALNNTLTNVIFRSQFSPTKGFRIEVDTGNPLHKVQSIYVNKVLNNQIYIPNELASSFKATNKTFLQIQETNYYDLYVISVIAQGQNIKLLIRKDVPIVLTHNQQHRQVVPASSIFSYKIFTTGSIAIFLATNSQHPSISINKNYNTTSILTISITNKSAPWHYIQALNNELVTYDITIYNNASEDIAINIMYQENDSLAYQRLYEGIIVYDAFVSKQEVNCYYYDSPMLVGRKDIVIDFVFSKDLKCDCASSFSFQYQAYTKNNLISSKLEVLSNNPLSYRLKLAFVPKQNYTICFHTSNLSALNKEYYVLLNDPSMQHLIEGYTLTQIYQNSYDMYEIVEEGLNQNIMIELTSCIPTSKNQRVLVGSSSFTQSQLGRFTDLEEYYKNTDSLFAKLSVNEGYYYLGVKNNIYLNELLNTYTLRFQDIGNDQRILANTWQLKNNKIVKIFKDKTTQKLTIEVPQILNTNAMATKSNLTITYTIYILNMDKYHEVSKIPMNILARCPNYHAKKLDQFPKRADITEYLQNRTVTFYYDNATQYNKKPGIPVFVFDPESIPLKFNITGKIEVGTNNQKFNYYYDTTFSEVDPRYEEEGDEMTVLLSVLLVITALLVIGAASYVCYKRYKSYEEKKKVAFEMANFNHAEGDSTVRRQQRQSLKSGGKKGYGQFVDQIN